MDKISTNNKEISNDFFIKRLKDKLFSKVTTQQLIMQTTLAGMLIALAIVMERFVMLDFGPFEICFGFFIVLLFPLLLDFKIAVIAAITSQTLTEFLISGEGTFWINFLAILISFPIIRAFMVFNNRWVYLLGLILAMSVYILIGGFQMKMYLGPGFEVMFLASKTIQMLVAIPLAISLYIPIKKLLPRYTDQSWGCAEKCCTPEDDKCC